MIPTTSSLKREKPPPYSDVVSEPCNTIDVFLQSVGKAKFDSVFSADNVQRCLSLPAGSVAYQYINLVLLLIKHLNAVAFLCFCDKMED